MPFINSILNWLNIKRLHQINLFKEHPFYVQQDMFFKLISRAKNTTWGEQYKYSSIESINQFQETVPIQTYEQLSPYIQRLKDGEQNLLWPSDIRWFAKSSGTTNEKSKFIPVSREALEDCHYRGGKDILAIFSNNFPETDVFKGKGLTLGGSHQVNSINGESYVGDLSAILIENLPMWVDFIRTPNQEVALIPKWEEKLEKITKITIHENVTSLSGVPSWIMVMLKYIVEKNGKDNILEIWPNLELFIHGGVSFIPYREQYKKIIPSAAMKYMETYNASEGFFAIQDDPESDAMLLMLDYSIFYEFIELGSIGEKYPKAYTVGDVETGKNYAMVISTNGGLWRYLIGDTITFTSLYPHKIKITGRTKHFINAFGEEIIIENAENALKTACSKTGAIISEYTAGPVFMGDDAKGAHEWLIEFEKEPGNIDYFANLLDHALMSVNSDYEAKRYKNITLEQPKIRNLQKGTFYKWLEKKGKLGGQNKVPRLANDRKYIEELMAIVNETRKV